MWSVEINAGMKNGMIVSFDLDMTLMDQRTWEIPESAQRAIEALRENGNKIVIASGRDMDAPFSRAYRDLVKPDAIIHLNGTKITVGSKEIYDHTFDAGLLRRVLDFAQAEGLCIGATLNEKDYFVNPQLLKAHDEERFGESRRNCRPLSELPVKKVRTLHYIGSAEGAVKVEVAFPQVKLLMFSDGTGAVLVEQASSKAAGLWRLCQYYRMGISQTAAFGDSMNDYEMIQAAGTGIAMGNAVEQLKSAADYVTTDIDQDGIWNACCHLGYIQADQQ